MTLHPIITLNSVTALGAQHCGAVVVAGSHGGVYPAYLSAKAGVAGVILNDAGVGKDEAGIGSLSYLEDLRIPAATIDANSARIGDGEDMLSRGVISFANGLATALGVDPGMTCSAAAVRLQGATCAISSPPEFKEARFVIGNFHGIPVLGLDSVSLVLAQDVASIIITGSHGGILGGQPKTAVKYDVLSAIFHDAGIGADQAGISRLWPLDERGIPAGAVEARSARVGDAQSLWETGILSAVNANATKSGAVVGITVREFVDRIGSATRKRAI